MYTKVGTRPESRRLVDLAGQFNLQPSKEGYATSPCELTRQVYQPVLSDVFHGKWTHCLLSVIWANGTIPPHCDGDTVNSGAQRFHLVLQSNERAWVRHDDTWQQMEENGIYTMDPSIEHAAVNWGSEPRVHLVVDVLK